MLPRALLQALFVLLLHIVPTVCCNVKPGVRLSMYIAMSRVSLPLVDDLAVLPPKGGGGGRGAQHPTFTVFTQHRIVAIYLNFKMLNPPPF